MSSIILAAADQTEDYPSKYENTNLKCLIGAYEDNFVISGVLNKGITHLYYAWEDAFPLDRVLPLKVSGSILLMSWEPRLKKNPKKSILADIINSKYDKLISDFALSAKKYAAPMFLRWGHEMNGDWYPWSGKENNKNPELYKKAFIHIVDIFKKLDCRNVKFVFCVNREDLPDEKWNNFENYYPGDQYVDCIGVDLYNWGTKNKWSKWQTLSELFTDSYNRIKKAFPDKPIIIAETGCTSAGGNKVEWIDDFFKTAREKFKAVKAVVWFDSLKEYDLGAFYKPEFRNAINKNIDGEYFTVDHKELIWLFEEK